jgi:hypothetical protein
VTYGAGAGGILFIPALLMILFREKYPRWWFDWNRELLRFSNRVLGYLLLLDDRYPSIGEQQYVRLDLDYPDTLRTISIAGYRSSSGSWRSPTMWCSSSLT